MNTRRIMPDHSSKGSSPRSLKLNLCISFLLLMFVLLSWAAMIILATPDDVKIPDLSQVVMEHEEPEKDIIHIRRELYQQEIVPLLNETSARNQEAADNAINEIKTLFRGYKSNVDVFVEDLMSYSTRASFLWNLPGDWIKDDGRLEKIVSEKFETHIFSEDDLINDIASILSKFAQEIHANENNLLMECRAAIHASDIPEIVIPGYEEFAVDVMDELSVFLMQKNKVSVYNWIFTLVASEVIGITVTWTLKGSIIGSFIPGKGTILGLIIGIVAGSIADILMIEKTKEKMSINLVRYLYELEKKILAGSSHSMGLGEELQDFAKDYSAVQRKTLEDKIMEVK